ncbi:TipAS antibiotic-recognition domain-containing protein [Acidovorax sp. LjRoot117]|uniref:TipAS antibiotic-recognition domain-containing protein n=1 Tax=Acidovorax sp. LjRoot117 TaxID=3342255 RepID=UPI003ECF312B
MVCPQVCRTALAEEQAHSLATTNNWAHVDKAQVHRDWDTLYKKLVILIPDYPPYSPVIQELIAEHHKIVSRFYTPSKMAYIGMSLYYVEDPDMTKYYFAYHPGMASFLSEAIPFCAEAHLR